MYLAITVQVASVLSMAFRESHALWVTVPETCASTLCGLSGDFHMGARDNFSGSNNMWLSDAHGSTTGIGSPIPGFLWMAGCCDGPHQACNEAVEPWVHVENCIHYLCATGGSRDSFHVVMGSSVQECQRHGLPVQP